MISTFSAALLLCACGSENEGAVATVDAGSAGTDAAPVADASSDAAFGNAGDAGAPHDAATLALTSTAFVDGGAMAATYTCDAQGVSPPLAWSGLPAGTAELALLMTTEARDGRKWNWVLHSIPTSKTAIAEGAKDVGVAGLTSDGPLLQYYPPCSQGPGAKGYTFTVYALAAKPALPSVPNQVTGAVVEAAVSNLTLAKASLTVSYTRP
jgi:phosphatidylethanolamine-binding protein (PEBP) family uncharacterized protein